MSILSADTNERKLMLEAVYFEQWIRFRWIEEEPDGYFVRVPEQDISVLRKTFPHFQFMLEDLNNRQVSAERSCEVVMEYGRSRLGDRLEDVLASSAFQEQVSRFHVWLASMTEKTNASSPSFEEWLEHIPVEEEEGTF